MGAGNWVMIIGAALLVLGLATALIGERIKPRFVSKPAKTRMVIAGMATVNLGLWLLFIYGPAFLR